MKACASISNRQRGGNGSDHNAAAQYAARPSGSLTNMLTSCERCDRTGLVCEVHDDRPWDSGASERPCKCRAPGMPCPDCNAADPPKMPPGFAVTVDDKGPRN